jgi:hypothetical protein
VDLSLRATEVLGGEVIAGRFAVNGPLPSDSARVYLTLSPRDVAEAPESFDVPSGSRAVDFVIHTKPVSTSRDVVLTASYQGIQYEAKFTVRAQLALRLISDEIVGGTVATVTVDLGVASPDGSALVKLHSSREAIVAAPPEITVPKGQRTARFVVNTQPVGRTENVVLRAQRGSLTGQIAVRVRPKFDLQLQQANLVGGQSTEGRLALGGPAPPGGATLDLTSSDPEILSVPATVVIPAGQRDGYFEVRTAPVPGQRQPAVTARYESHEESLEVNLQADFQLTVMGNGLTSGGGLHGTIQLSGPAPEGAP